MYVLHKHRSNAAIKYQQINMNIYDETPLTYEEKKLYESKYGFPMYIVNYKGDVDYALQLYSIYAVALMKLYSLFKSIPVTIQYFKYPHYNDVIIKVQTPQELNTRDIMLQTGLMSSSEYIQLVAFENETQCQIDNSSLFKLAFERSLVNCTNGRYQHYPHNFQTLHAMKFVKQNSQDSGTITGSGFWRATLEMFHMFQELLSNSSIDLGYYDFMSTGTDIVLWNMEDPKVTPSNWMTLLLRPSQVFDSPQFRAVIRDGMPEYQSFLTLTQVPLTRDLFGRTITLEESLLRGQRSKPDEGYPFRNPGPFGPSRKELPEDVVSKIGSFLTGKSTYRVAQQNPVGSLNLKGGRPNGQPKKTNQTHSRSVHRQKRRH